MATTTTHALGRQHSLRARHRLWQDQTSRLRHADVVHRSSPSLSSILDTYKLVSMHLIRRKEKDERTGAEVAKEYRSRINDFFENVTRRNLSTIPGEGDALDKLCLWSHKAESDRIHFQNLYQNEMNRRNEVERQRNDLSNILSQNEVEIRELKADARDLKKQHNSEIDEIKKRHKTEIDSWGQRYDHETDRLKGQLRVDEHTEKPWPDDVLKLRLQELQGLIKEVTRPPNMRLGVPDDQQTLDFDPSRFLYRVSQDKGHLLFKDRIWHILNEHFFGLPFGFGVLGIDSQDGNTLLRALTAWNSVFHNSDISGSGIDAELLIFKSNATANIWRAATFKSAFINITKPGDEGSSHFNETSRRSKNNLERTVSRIENLIHQALPYMASPVPVNPTKLRELADLARKLAFQFGVNPDCLQLWIPQQGQQLEISDEVHDYRNQGYGEGATVTVEMVASPGLRKVAYDDKGNITSILTIKPCEILAVESR